MPFEIYKLHIASYPLTTVMIHSQLCKQVISAWVWCVGDLHQFNHTIVHHYLVSSLITLSSSSSSSAYIVRCKHGGLCSKQCGRSMPSASCVAVCQLTAWVVLVYCPALCFETSEAWTQFVWTLGLMTKPAGYQRSGIRSVERWVHFIPGTRVQMNRDNDVTVLSSRQQQRALRRDDTTASIRHQFRCYCDHLARHCSYVHRYSRYVWQQRFINDLS